MKFPVLLKMTGVLALLFPIFLKAELPPYAYQKFQDESPEKLEISIIALTTKQTEREHRTIRRLDPQAEVQKIATTKIEAQAKVQKVFRTASHLTAGQIINIHYQIKAYHPVICGPSQPMHVKTSETYIAYLKAGDGFYSLGAMGRSFIPAEVYYKYHMEE
ncbi:MAG: hypothetical protein OXC48_00930 [Endozoicomonadaceae bacterium]|nr:hypothetical protein [Endozoicomonadaceae bacterium]